MNGPRIGAVTITDKEGIHYKVCPVCLNAGCPSCHQTGRVRIHPVRPVSSFHPGTVVASPALPGHTNHLAPSLVADLENTWQVDIDGDGKVSTL